MPKVINRDILAKETLNEDLLAILAMQSEENISLQKRVEDLEMMVSMQMMSEDSPTKK